MADPFSRKWYYNSDTGSIALRPVWDPLNHAGVGWHGPFDTEQQAIDFYVQGKASNPGWHEPTSSLWQQLKNSISSNPVEKAKDNAANKLSELNPLNKLNSITEKDIKPWAIRISEILLGLILIGVGLAKLTGQSSNDLTKAATKAVALFK